MCVCVCMCVGVYVFCIYMHTIIVSIFRSIKGKTKAMNINETDQKHTTTSLTIDLSL